MEQELKVVFEDNHILVVIKPQNVLSQGDETGDESMVDIAKNYLKAKYNKPGNVYLGLVHRLDRPTGGIMVLAKTSKAAERLTAQLQDGGFEKRYLAVLVGAPKEKSAMLTHYLEKDEDKNIVKALTYAKMGAKKSDLYYTVLENKEKLCLCDIQLYTGRSHQIRSQFKAEGVPVFGDVKYGGDIAKGWNLALWSYKLKLTHPVTKESLSFVVYPPKDDMPWKNFNIESYFKYSAENN